MRTTDEPDVSVLIVTYGNPELTATCLESVYAEAGDVTFEVLVHDNDSPDATPDVIAERFPQADLSRDMGNLGFARANNLLAERARGRFLLLLNPDTVVHDGAVARLVRAAGRHPQAVPLGGRTLTPGGDLDPGSCWGELTLWSLLCFATGLSTAFAGSVRFDPESLGPWARDSFREVGVVTGCLALLPRTAWEELGGFDERFWLYGEDMDLSLRARARGWRPAITPDAVITHVYGASSKTTGAKRIKVLQSKVTILQKHWSPGRRRVGVAFLLLGVVLRAGLEKLARRADPSWGVALAARRAWMAGFPPTPSS